MTDNIARGMAGGSLKKAGRVANVPGGFGIQIFGGRMDYTFDCTSGATWEMVMELPGDALDLGYVQVIVAQSQASTSPASPGFFVDVKAISALSDLDGPWTGTTSTTWTGPSAAQLRMASSVFRRRFEWSDPALVTPVARTDGGSRPLIAARIYVGSGATNIELMGNGGGDSFSNWATRPDGLVRIRKHNTAGDQRTATTNWSAFQGGPVIGFAWSARRRLISVAQFGDSIDEGRGTYLGAGFGLRATELLNKLSLPCSFSHQNMAWAGQGSSTMYDNMRDAFAQGIIPDIAIFPLGSPNDTLSPLDATIVSSWRRYSSAMLGLCAQYGVVPIVRTVLPVNYSVRQWGASDELRRNYNTEAVVDCTNRGILCADLAGLFGAGIDGNGQEIMSPSYQSDNIHPNNAGIEACASVIAERLKAAAGF